MKLRWQPAVCIIVEGAGLAVINGTYNRLADHCYAKEGHWNGANRHIYDISKKGTHWFFWFSGGTGLHTANKHFAEL